MVDKEQSGAVAAAESSRRDAEAKAKEESDLVNSCQVPLLRQPKSPSLNQPSKYDQRHRLAVYYEGTH